MKKNAMFEMEKILDLKFQRKQQVFSKVLAQEAKLRAQIGQLNEQEQDAEQSNQQHIKAIGADVIWKAWLERTKTALNMELAQVLAQKERLLVSVRKDYGKLLVSRQLLRKQGAEIAHERQKKSLNTSIESHFHNTASTRD